MIIPTLDNLNLEGARPGFEPGTSNTLCKNHTPRPTSHTFYVFLFNINGPFVILFTIKKRTNSLDQV